MSGEAESEIPSEPNPLPVGAEAVPVISSTLPATGSLPPATKRKHRKWPWVLLVVVLVIVLGAWFGLSAYGDNWIATNGKDPDAIGVCPFSNCTDVIYTGQLGAWYAPPAGGHPTVVIVHGYGANRGDHSTVGTALQHLGYGVMAIDLGYEGDSPANDMKYGGGVREADGVKAAVTYAKSRSADPVVLLGYSAGGTESILAINQGADAAAVVADSSPVSFVHLATDRISAPSWLFVPAPLLYSMFSPGGSLGSLSSLGSSYHGPTLVIQGTADQTVNPSNGPAVQQLTHGTLWTVPGVGHTGTATQCMSAYVTQLNTFYSDAVSGKAFQLDPTC